jgi:hypothetical protein
MPGLLRESDIQEFSAPIGRVVLAGSNLEGALRDLVGIVLNANSDTQERPISQQLDQVQKLAREAKLPLPEADAECLIRRIREAIHQRNIIVHGY